MDFQQAIAYVKQHHAAAYAYVPLVEAEQEVGGTVYLLAYNTVFPEDPQEYWEYLLDYAHGYFHNDLMEADVIAPPHIPANASTLHYHPVPLVARTWMEYPMQILKSLLQGPPLALA